MPTATLQYRCQLAPQQINNYRFLFGPAKERQQIEQIKQQFFSRPLGFEQQITDYKRYIAQGVGSIHFHSNDAVFDQYVNYWLPRQMFYHGDVNRLSTDPQTRNYLQDCMGMSYIASQTTRTAFLTALSQQNRNGSMPEGILIHQDATLKYINQIPHTDHCVWLPICLQAYLSETDDQSLLTELISFSDSDDLLSVKQHVELALDYLVASRDERGLSYINQGDWCDPMNMVGYKGLGISTWLSLATAYALNTWVDICATLQHPIDSKYKIFAEQINLAVNEHCWFEQWFSRGITDEGVSFGVPDDVEGRIFLNPQSWALLSGAASPAKIPVMLKQIEQQLDTPYGTMMLAPSYTKMRDDVGRITQKFPGSAENGSVYNHAAIFYAFSLYSIGEGDKAFRVIRNMLPDDDCIQRGQLANFIPNYYRGAYYQHPSRAGRSSQLFNTGTVSWLYRCLIEGIAGLKGDRGDLLIQPQLPQQWPTLAVVRHFNGAIFNVNFSKSKRFNQAMIKVDNIEISGNRITNIIKGKTYAIDVVIPEKKELVIVVGVSGSGKSTIASLLANILNYQLFEADDFHSPLNKRLMAEGVPLSDTQRVPWISDICQRLSIAQARNRDCVLAFSGLRSAHRQKFRELGFRCRFIYLQADADVIAKRLQNRRDHFFNADLLNSQFDALQTPVDGWDLETVNANLDITEVYQQALKFLQKDER